MEKQYYTFNELKEIYHWSTNEGGIQKQIRYAKNHGVKIKQAFKKGKTYFEIILEEEKEEENLYTFKEIKNKFHWTTRLTSDSIKNQIQFAKNRGCIIELASNKKPHLFKIISEPPTEKEWFLYPQNNKYEITKKGMVRNQKTKRILGSTDFYGYQIITDTSQNPPKRYKIHRMVLETFNPIENAEMYVVDHINGIKNDNRLENLRWLTQRHNMQERDENYAKLNENYQKLIQKYGYEGLNHLFLTILNEI